MGNNYTNMLARASINNLVDAVHATFMPVSVINRSAGIIKIYVYILLFILLFIFVFGIEVDLIPFFFFISNYFHAIKNADKCSSRVG